MTTIFDEPEDFATAALQGFAAIYGRYVRHVKEVVGEILLDDIAFVSEADHEVIYSMSGIDLHDVPKNWLTADFDHRLWPRRRLFANPATEASG